jgi:CheY-like chemotaxis protein
MGWVEVASKLGQGTTIDIYLPRCDAAVHHAEAPPLAAASAGHETILFVDDEPFVRRLAEQTLRRAGYRVLTAEDGLAAVEVFARQMQEIDLVVLDLTMPRLSGRDALRRMTAIDANVRVLLSSGYSIDQAPALDEPGVVGFLSKPYRPVELCTAVRKGLDLTRPVR